MEIIVKPVGGVYHVNDGTHHVEYEPPSLQEEHLEEIAQPVEEGAHLGELVPQESYQCGDGGDNRDNPPHDGNALYRHTDHPAIDYCRRRHFHHPRNPCDG